MEKYTATTAAEETTDAKPELVAHVAKTLEGVNQELAHPPRRGEVGGERAGRAHAAGCLIGEAVPPWFSG